MHTGQHNDGFATDEFISGKATFQLPRRTGAQTRRPFIKRPTEHFPALSANQHSADSEQPVSYAIRAKANKSGEAAQVRAIFVAMKSHNRVYSANSINDAPSKYTSSLTISDVVKETQFQG